MTTARDIDDAPAAPAAGRMRLPVHWLGLLPFALFAVLFLVLPTMKIVVGAFQNNRGEITFENIASLATPSILSAYWISIRVSVASAVLGGMRRSSGSSDLWIASAATAPVEAAQMASCGPGVMSPAAKTL